MIVSIMVKNDFNEEWKEVETLGKEIFENMEGSLGEKYENDQTLWIEAENENAEIWTEIYTGERYRFDDGQPELI